MNFEWHIRLISNFDDILRRNTPCHRTCQGESALTEIRFRKSIIRFVINVSIYSRMLNFIKIDSYRNILMQN